MKKLVITLIIALLTVAGITARAEAYPEEYLGLPGDNLNLYAVMKLFQESETLEEFERRLNDQNSRINNLDLNGDNLVDYIMVFDYVDGNVHNIVLRVALNAHENQDVAVFTVQRLSNGSVQIQLIGDEALYGRNYIIEPIYAENQNETPNPGYIGRVRTNPRVTVVHTTTYEVATWPLIRFIFLPGYVTWRSSWYWGYRPHYWNPWRPYYWHTYYGYHYHWHHHYYKHYRHWHHPRYARYNNFYYSNIRSYSPRITININNGRYRSTYSRPDLRSKGSELYAMSARNTNSGVRRSDNQSVRVAAKNGTGAVNQRRSTTSVNRKAASPNTVNSGTVNTRRSSATVNNRVSTSTNNKGAQTVRRSAVNTNNASTRPATSNTRRSNVSTRPASENSQKPVTSINKKSSANSSVRTNTSIQGRSSGSVTRRPATRPSVGKANVKSGTTRSSVTRRSPVNNSVRKSTGITQKSAKSQSSRVTSRPSTGSSNRSAVSRGGSGQRSSQPGGSRR